MNTNELYPELVDYIYDYADKFKTEKEHIAHRMLIYARKGMSASTLNRMKGLGWYDDGEEIKAMVAGGYEVFKRKVVERIYREHRHELNLNCCPKCGKITRTPWAKQCRFCFHQWHLRKY